jgi:hypothetical protein
LQIYDDPIEFQEGIMNRLLHPMVLSGGRCFSAVVVAITLFVSFLLPVPARADLAPFQNGDFSGGFSGWTGLLFPVSGSVNPSSDPHFSLVGGQGAQIANDDFDYMVFRSRISRWIPCLPATTA